jgi:hypothetical protein
MAGKVWIITLLVLIVFVFDGMMGRAKAPIAPGPTTPTELTINLNKVSLKPGLLTQTWIDYVTTTTPVDVIASSTGITSPSTDTTDSSFGTGVVPAAEYKQVKIVLDGMATYTGTDPCTGDMALEESIELPGMVASSEDGLNKVSLKYQEPHPVTGVPAGSIGIEAFTVSGPFEFRLVFPASNSVICAADVAPLRTITGTLDGPNGLALDSNKGWMFVTNGGLSESVAAYDRTGTSSAIRASISGTKTGLSNPVGIYVDGAPHYEIGVANTGNNSVTIYDNSPGATLGDVTPLHVITGTNTKLSGPGGIAIYAVSGDSTIVVANGGNNSVTFYSHNALQSCPFPVNCNIPPLYLAPLHGSLTGLNAPCGLYVDTFNQEIGVANNGNSSVTVYKLDDIAASVDGNVPPVRTIQGPDTGLSVPCGLYVDTINQEIGVTNNGNDTITFYQRTDQGDVAPTRTLRGNATGLNGPVGVYLDPDYDQIVVANRHNDRTDDTVTAYNREELGVQLKGPPALHISAEQQSLLVQYFYAGQLYKQTGMPVAAPPQGVDCDGDGIPDIASGEPIVCFDGYHFDWKITDDRVRQLGDATTLGMIPPSNAAFRLTDGSVLSVLSPGCPVLTPFIILELFTNCPPLPMISAPLPPPSGDYSIPAVIFQETKLTNKIRYTSTSLAPSQFPQLIPVLSLNPDNTISSINWVYASELANPPTPPLIVSQGFQINLTQDIGDVSPCYTQVSGNAQSLVYSSGSLTSDTRDRDDITNNGCGIYLSDVDTITFTVTDALGNNYVFTWNPI